MSIDWAAMNEAMRFPERMLYVDERRVVAEQTRSDPVAIVPRAAPSMPVPTVQQLVPAERAPASALIATHVATATPLDTVATLHAALDGAPDDEARAALLAAASDETRSQLANVLAYRRFIADVARAAENDERKREDFTRLLDAAVDDATRVAIIRAADPAMVAEWRWRASATEESWKRRYMALVGVTTT